MTTPSTPPSLQALSASLSELIRQLAAVHDKVVAIGEQGARQDALRARVDTYRHWLIALSALQLLWLLTALGWWLWR